MLQMEYGLQSHCFTTSVRLEGHENKVKTHKLKSSGTGEGSVALLFQTVICQSGAAFLSFTAWTWLGQGV